MQIKSLSGFLRLALLIAFVSSSPVNELRGDVELSTSGSTVDHFWSSSEGSEQLTYSLEPAVAASRVVGDPNNGSVTVFDYRLAQTPERLTFEANSYVVREAGNPASDAFVTFLLRFRVDEPMIYRLNVQRAAAQGLYFALGETDLAPFEVYIGFEAARYRTEDYTSQGTLTAGDYSLVTLNRATELDFPTIPGTESQVVYNFEVQSPVGTVQPVPEPLTILATTVACGFGWLWHVLGRPSRRR